jgi:hypothetical protein
MLTIELLHRKWLRRIHSVFSCRQSAVNPSTHPDVVGGALAVISLKKFDDKLAVEHEMMAKRNSFRDLHRPDLSHLDWVQYSAADKKEVRLFVHV